MHLSMYYIKLFNISIYPCSCSWACFPIGLVLVASSSPVGGSGTLQDATLYCQLVGSILYLTHSHTDLSFVIGHVACYMQTPHEIHWKAAKIILRYIQGTIQFGIHYNIGWKPLLFGFTDSDWADNIDVRKSTTDFVSFWDLDMSLGLVRNNKILSCL